MSALHKVLVVDDDPVVAKSFDRVLSSDKGYVVITAHDGPEALEKLRSEEFDVVYTDIKMPGMDGLEVAERVKARKPWTPVVIITGYGTEANEARASAAGVSAFLHKPLSPEMIEDSVMKAMREAPAAAPVEAEPAAVEAPAEVKSESKIKNIALFMVAPFVGLAYLVLFPFIGLGMMAWFGAKEFARIAESKPALKVVKNVVMVLAAPVIGLGFVVVAPFAGIAALVWAAVSPRTPNAVAKTD
jgi:CheY-like chemotaxis protein